MALYLLSVLPRPRPAETVEVLGLMIQPSDALARVLREQRRLVLRNGRAQHAESLARWNAKHNQEF